MQDYPYMVRGPFLRRSIEVTPRPCGLAKLCRGLGLVYFALKSNCKLTALLLNLLAQAHHGFLAVRLLFEGGCNL